MIPLVDLAIQRDDIADEVRAGWEAVLDRTAFVLGDEVGEFEAAFAEFTGVPNCIGVGNGTDAIELALRACGVGPGDEVILPANTFVATALAVARVGARPVLVDVDPDSSLVDAARVEAKMGGRVRAVLPVHLYGQLAPIEDLAEVGRAHGAVIIEDAAQCHGALRYGRHAGHLGDAAATSFYPGKNLGAYGDAGAVLTGSDELASRIRRLRNWGGETKYEHPDVGFNSRLDTLQAVVLTAKLRRLQNWNEQRRDAARVYDAMLEGAPEVVRPRTLPGNVHVWHLYVVRVRRRDLVLEALKTAGIGAGVHYRIPIHLQGAFACLGHKPGDFPITEELAGSILSLPIYPGITTEQQRQVVDAVLHAIRR